MFRILWLRLGTCLAVAATVFLAGCSGGYDVELNGGIFDAVGLSSVGKKAEQPRVERRNGIVMPPQTASLPVPGSGRPTAEQVAAISGQEAWPVDPEQSKAQNEAQQKALHEAFCERARDRYNRGLDPDVERGPLGSCQKSIVRSFTGKAAYYQGTTNKPAQRPSAVGQPLAGQPSAGQPNLNPPSATAPIQ
ncbi:MAG: hypothetical protein ACR2PG_17805 [Hyphomicrobiaceae bacterium]